MRKWVDKGGKELCVLYIEKIARVRETECSGFFTRMGQTQASMEEATSFFVWVLATNKMWDIVSEGY